LRSALAPLILSVLGGERSTDDASGCRIGVGGWVRQDNLYACGHEFGLMRRYVLPHRLLQIGVISLLTLDRGFIDYAWYFG
jgi:hypothetical protein